MQNDNSLAETLGNLGRSLSGALNPLNQLRGYQLQQRMFLEQEQLRQLQREGAAKTAAVQQWGHIVPPDKLPQIAAMIYQGAPYDQIARAAAQLSGNLVDDPARMQDNIRYIEQITGKPYDYATEGPPVAGPNTAKAHDDWKVQQAGATAGATKSAEIGAEQTSRAPLSGMIDEDTPEAAKKNLQIYRQVYGKDPDNGLVDAGPVTQAANRAKLAVQDATKAGLGAQATAQGKAQTIQDLTKLYVDKNDPASDANNRVVANAIEAAGGPKAPLVGYTVPAGPVTNEIFKQQQAQQAGATKTQETAAVTSQTPQDAAKPQIFIPAPAAQAPAAPAPAPAPAQTPTPAPPAAAPAAVRQLRPGFGISGYTVSPQVNTTGPVFGVQPGAADAAQKETSQYFGEVSSAFNAGGDQATKLKATVAQLRALSDAMHTTGLYGQVTGAMRDKLNALGLGNVTDAQMAQSTADNLLKTLIPELKSDYNIQRVAQPEIALLGKVTGTADMPAPVLNSVLANLDQAADYSIAKRGLASRVLNVGSSGTPLDYPDYVTEDNKLLQNYQPQLDARRVQFGAANAVPSQPAAPAPPVFQWGDILHGIQHLFRGGGGGDSPAPPVPTPMPAPNGPSTELRPNANGDYFPVQ